MAAKKKKVTPYKTAQIRIDNNTHASYFKLLQTKSLTAKQVDTLCARYVENAKQPLFEDMLAKIGYSHQALDELKRENHKIYEVLTHWRNIFFGEALKNLVHGNPRKAQQLKYYLETSFSYYRVTELNTSVLVKHDSRIFGDFTNNEDDDRVLLINDINGKWDDDDS